MSALDGCYEKLRWAQGHRQLLKDKIATEHLEERPAYGLRWDRQLHNGNFGVYVEEPWPISPDYALILGDFCNNIRSVLDHLAWLFVARGRSPQPRYPNKVGWPIEDTKSRFDSQRGVMIPGIRLKHLALVRRDQPYCFAPEAHTHWLWLLKLLNNADKHRQVHMMLAYPEGTYHLHISKWRNWRGVEAVPTAASLGFITGSLKPGTKVADVFGHVTGPNPGVEMSLEGKSRLLVQTEDAVWPVVHTVDNIGDMVALILSEATDLLRSG